jgi:saccharopine dehydrogenase-like NADP-dependent oxidoreductase
MGTEATRDLVLRSDFDEVAIGDLNEGLATALARELGGKATGRRVDVTDESALAEAMRGFDVVLNCTSYAFGLTVTKAALRARRPLLDLGGLYNTPKQLALSEEAKAAGVLIVLGMGATPGVTNLMAQDAASHMNVEELHVSFATFRPLAPSPGLLSTVLDEFSPQTKRFYFEGGKHVEARPFEGARTIRFAPPVGEITAYYVPHSEVHTLPRFIPSVQRVYVRGTWRPEIMEVLRHYGDIGLLADDPIDVRGTKVAPKALLSAVHLQRHPWPDDRIYAFYVNVEARGTRDGRAVARMYNLAHPPREKWGTSATGKVTGIPAAIGTEWVAKGQVRARAGVFAPEAVFAPQPFFAALAERDIHVRATIPGQE